MPRLRLFFMISLISETSPLKIRSEIKEIMKKSRNLGMQTFDQALFDAYEANVISYEDALRNADSLNDLRLQIKLNSQRAKSPDLAQGTEHFAIV